MMSLAQELYEAATANMKNGENEFDVSFDDVVPDEFKDELREGVETGQEKYEELNAPVLAYEEAIEVHIGKHAIHMKKYNEKFATETNAELKEKYEDFLALSKEAHVACLQGMYNDLELKKSKRDRLMSKFNNEYKNSMRSEEMYFITSETKYSDEELE